MTKKSQQTQKQISQIHTNLLFHTMLMIAITSIINFLTSCLPPFSIEHTLIDGYDYFTRMSNFDGMHFLTNQYNYEQNYVFLPGFTLFVRLFKYLSNSNMNITIFCVTTINRILIYFTSKQLFSIARSFDFSNKHSKLCSIMFIYNPAAIFYHSLYSQSIYAFLIFRATRCYLQNKNCLNFAVMIALATLIRSTAIFLVPIVGLEILSKFFVELRQNKWKEVFKIGVKGATILVIIFLPFVLYLLWAYSQVCSSIEETQQCSKFINVYSWAQQKYWDVGFLNYFKYNNRVFIAIGLPSILFSCLTLKIHKQNFAFLGMDLSYLIQIIIIVTLTNIQSSTRFFSSHPLFYINILAIFSNYKYSYLSSTIRYWWGLYCFIGIFLFYLGHPWT